MRRKQQFHLNHRLVFILSLVALLTIFGLSRLVPVSAHTEVAQQIQQAWQLAQRSGTYRFSTDIVQTTYPAPALANVGRSPREATLHIEGDIDQPARAMTLSLWNNGGSVANADEAIQVRVEGDQSYGRTGTGDWQPIDNVSSAFAPGNDVLAYFAGVRNIRSISAAPASDRAGGDLPVANQVGDHLAFDVDGVAFGNYLRDQLEKELSAQGRLPAGLSLDLSSQYRGVLGSGEVWLDADGLPQRLTVNIAFPEQANGERVEAQIQTDFANFNRERIAQATTPEQWAAGLIASWPLPRSAQDWQSIGISALALASTLAFVTLMILQRRSRRLYTALTLVFIFAIVFSPLLQATQVYAASADLAAQNAQAENNQLAAQADRSAQTQLATTTWNPHADPLASNVQPLAANFQLPTSNLQLQTATTPAPTSDTDLDGLTYAQETLLGTNPDRADTDGDNIQDGVEARGFAYGNQTWYLNPLDPDTNVDGLVDGEECASALGKKFTDPTSLCQDTDNDATPDAFDRDNDGDGVPDSIDLSPFKAIGTSSTPFNKNNPFLLKVQNLQRGADGKGLPTFVDIQLRPITTTHLSYALNVLDWPGADTDGQIQRVLTTTFASTMSASQIAADPRVSNGDLRLIPMLEVTMGGTNVPLPLTNPRATASFVGDVGGNVTLTQVGANVSLSFALNDANTYTATLHSGTCNALSTATDTYVTITNGAVRTALTRNVVALADGAHAVRLMGAGKQACATLGDIPNGLFTAQMIDTSLLQAYGISVRDLDRNGNLMAYVPLNLVQDQSGGGRVAFTARMVYQSNDPANWGNNHEYRVVWLAQMLTDRCNTSGLTIKNEADRDKELAAWCGDPAHRDQITQIVHAYNDDWTLTGLSVREDRGLSVAIGFEDPANDNYLDSDDRLWQLARGLDVSFIKGRDCETVINGACSGNGQRDITINEIKRRFDITSTATITERWGIPANATRLLTFNYPQQDYSAHIMMTETKQALNTYFMTAGTPRTDAPTLLFAREEKSRDANLELGGTTAAITKLTDGKTLLTVNLDPTTNEEKVITSLSWAPYRYRNGQWESYPIAEYLDKMQVRFKSLFVPIDNTPTSLDIAAGQIELAKSAYLSLFNGESGLVQVGQTFTGQADPAEASPDSALVDRVKTSIGLKGGVVNEFVKDIADSGFEALARAVNRGNPTALTGSALATTSFNVPLGNTQLTASQKFQEFLGKGIRGIKDKWAEAFTPDWARTSATTATRARTTGSKIGGGLMTVGALGAVSMSVWGATRQGGEGLSAANQALNGVHVVLALKGSLDLVNKVATGGLNSIRTLSSASIKAGVVGLIVSSVLGWGAFAYQVAGSSMQFGSLAFNSALAEVIAATVVAVILFAITLIPVVGQIIAAVIGLIDAVITSICGAVGSDFSENNAFGKRFCKGLSGLTAELIKGLIYGSRTLVGNLSKGDRLQISGFDTTLVDANKGFASDNQLSYQINVTNTLILNGLFDDTSSDEFKDRIIPIPFDWKALPYFWQYSVSNLKTATFDYKLQTSKTDFHDSVKRKTMDGSWQSVPGQSDAIFIAKSVSAAQSPLQDTGINRPVKLFLSEAYAVPVQECWAVPVPLLPPTPYIGLIPICYINTDSATQHIDLGQNLKYDVFPATLDGFYTLSAKDGGYSLAWGQSGDATFARQLDADGDGLLNPIDGGSDLDDSRWDADLDGLGDAYELSIGASPIKVDTDGDGLNDADEVVLGTNPLKQDTDGDGLTDKEEQTGWEFVYGFTANGTPLRTWFTADALQADTDHDGLTDFQEKTFGFNPRAVSNAQVLTYESSVREVSAPRLLLRLEEANGASTFADASGYINPVTCSSTNCPVAAVQGRFGNAALFDGTNDVVTLNDFSAFDTNRVSAVTVAAWVNPVDYVGYSPILAQENNAGAGYWLNLNSNGTMRFIVGNLSTNLDLSTVTAIPLNQWSHVAGTYDGSTVRIYINGVEAANAAFNGGMIVPHKTVRLGSDVAPNGYFNGRIDEAAVFDRALTAAEMPLLMNARYNPNDAVVKPGDTLAYSATVKNELFNRYANGLLSADFPAAVDSNVAPTTFVLQPLEASDMAGMVQVKTTATSGVANLNLVAGALINDRREASNFAETWLRFEESGAATTFADVSGNLPPRNGTCSGVTCPATGQAGAAGYAAQFNGSQFATVNDIDLANKSLTVAFWAKRATNTGPQWIIGQGTVANNNALLVGFLNATTFRCAFFNNDLDAPAPYDTNWHHWVCLYDSTSKQRTIYRDGVQVAQATAPANYAGSGPLSVGKDSIGQGGFNGALDDVRVFAKALSVSEVRELTSQTVLRLKFEKNALDSSGFGNNASCSTFVGMSSCPSYVGGISGEGAAFSGKQFVNLGASPSLDLRDGLFTLAAWVYPTSATTYPQGILGGDSGKATGLPSLQQVGLKVRFGFGTGTQWLDATTPADVLTLNTWNHVAITFDGVTARYFVNGVNAFESSTFNGQKPGQNAGISIGRSSSAAQTYINRIYVDDTNDGGGKAEMYATWNGSKVWPSGTANDVSGGNHYGPVGLLTLTDSGTLEVYDYDSGSGDDIVGRYTFDISQSAFGNQVFTKLGSQAGYNNDIVGRVEGSFDNNSIPFNGRLDDIVIYKRSLSASEIAGLQAAGTSGLQLRLDEVPGSTVFRDATGQTSAVCPIGQCPTAGIAGRIGQAVQFSGNQYLEAPVDVSETDYGISLWFKTSSASGGLYSVDSGSRGAGGYDRDLYLNNGQVCARVFNTETICTTGVNYADGVWHHLVHTFGGTVGAQKVYIDGVQKTAGNKALSDFNWQDGINLGYSSASIPPYLTGLIDDVRLFTKALSAADVQRIYSEAPQFMLRLDEAVNATTFINSGGGANAACSGTGCPKSGVKGQVGLAAQFDGVNDALSASGVNLANQSFTVAFWAKRTAPNRTDFAIGHGVAGGSSGLAIGFRENNVFTCAFGSNDLNTVDQYTDTNWNQWVCVYDAATKQRAIYRNGALVIQDVASASYTGFGNLLIGSSPYGAPFGGALDEGAIYNRVLADYEVRDLFQYQGKLVEERQAYPITIDADAPTSQISSGATALLNLTNAPIALRTYYANRPVVVSIAASDATARAALSELGSRKDGATTYTFVSAPACEDASNGAAWCPTFTPSGEGHYTLRPRTTDEVGNQQEGATTDVYVDGTAPNVTLTNDAAVRAAVPHPARADVWAVALNGTVSDPTLPGSYVGSGAVSLKVTLFTPEGKPVGATAQPATISGTNWSVNYSFDDVAPTGQYSVTLEAQDTVGNVTRAFSGSPLIRVDGTPAVAKLNLTNVPSNTLYITTTLRGEVTDAPAPAGAVARLHLDEQAGSISFADQSGFNHTGACLATCPTAGRAGAFGASVYFAENSVVTLGNFQTVGQVALSAWVQPVVFNGKRNLIAHGNPNTPEVFLRINDGKYEVGTFNGSEVVANTIAPTSDANQWVHLVGTYDGTAWRLYRNGVEVAKTISAIGVPTISGNWALGGIPVGGIRYFWGNLDEVQVFARALTPIEIRALASPAQVGVSRAEIAFTPVLPGSVAYNEPQPGGQLFYLPLDDTQPLSGALTFKDVSGNNRTGTCDSVCPQVGAPGRNGSAAQFGNGIAVGVGSINLAGQAFSAAIWAKRSSINVSSPFMGQPGYTPNTGFNFGFRADNTVTCGFFGNALNTSATYTDTDWHYWACTINPVNFERAIYRDGVQVARDVNANYQGAGAFFVGYASSSGYFNGLLDDARLFNRALSATEVQSLSIGSQPVLALGFEKEPEVRHGGSVIDQSGLQQRAVLNAGATDLANKLVAGRVGAEAIQLDGVNDSITVNDFSGFATDTAQSVSVSAWVNPADFVGYSPIVAQATSATNAGYWLNLSSNGTVRFIVGRTGSYKDLSTATAIPLNQWTHVAATYDGSTVKIYLNGALAVSGDFAGGLLVPNRILRIGTDDTPNGYFRGNLDDVRVYPRALTPSEIQAFYRNSWTMLTLSTLPSDASSAQWSLNVPIGLEGEYRVDTRGTDQFGRVDASGLTDGLWRGPIDTLAPRVTLTRTYLGSGLTARTQYRVTAEDFNLTLDSLGFAGCNLNANMTRQYFNAPWYLALVNQAPNSKLYSFDATCEVSGTITTVYSAYVYDTAGNGTTASITALNSPLKDTASQLDATLGLQQPIDLSRPTSNTPFDLEFTLSPYVLTSTAPITLTGAASAGGAGYLKALTITVDGTPIYTPTWPDNAITQTVWSKVWTPSGEGAHVIAASAANWNGANVIASQVITLVLDTLPPAISIDTTVITDTDYTGVGAIDITGHVTDMGGIHAVNVTLNGTPLFVGVNGNLWHATYYADVNHPPDGASFNVIATAQDVALRTTQISRTLTADVEPPSVSALNVTINGQAPEAGLLIDTPLIEANVSIAATSDGSGVSRYLYGWTNFLTYTLDQLNEHIVSPTQLIVSSLVLTDVENLDAAHDGEARYFHFIAEDGYGNQHAETFGPIYHDLPAKPDYIGMSEPLGPFESQPYRLWTNACSLIGTDTRIPREALSDAELHQAQSLYATWDHQALRLAWTGAHWNVDGDLFIYLDTLPDEFGGTYVRHGGNVAYNPYPATNPSTLALLPVSDWATPPGGSAPAYDAMNADYALWITDDHTVHLLRWDNVIDQWVEDAAAESFGVSYAFAEELDAPHTDLSIPFAQLGISDTATAQIGLVAFASEKDALRIWSVVPATNPADSARITLHTPPLGEPHKLTLTDRYTFALADGTCLSDSERLSFELEADHAGFTYNSTDDAVRLILGNTFSAAFDAYDAAHQNWLLNTYCPTHPTEPACRPDKPTHTLGMREQLEPLMETQFPPLLPGQHLSFTVLYDNEFAVTQTLPARLTADGLAWNADTPWLNGCVGWLNVVAAPNAHGTAIEFGGTVMSNGEGVVALDIHPADTLNPDCSITPNAGEPFASLHIDYDHDTDAPGYTAIKEPRALIAATNNTLYGAVLDHSPVPTITLEVQTPSNGTASQTCLDATPEDGEWTCAFNATTLNGGTPAHDEVFNVRARATDLFGNISAWTDWLALRVDANPPTMTLDAALQAVMAERPLNGEPILNGTASDDHAVKSITACDASGQDCAPARLTNNAASQTQTTFVADDTPSTPIPIGAGNGPQSGAALSSCGVGNFGIVRSFDIVSNFSIADVSLGLNIRHSYRSDLTAYLQSPSGTMATVISSTARTLAQNYDVLMTDATLDTLFADHIDHDLGVPLFEDARLPVTPFSVFRGEPALGTWLLLICDTDSTVDAGAYQRGELIVRGDLAPDHASTDWDYVLPNTQGVDGETRAYTLYGMDSLGNRTTSPTNVTLRIDTIAPVITVTNALQAATFISDSLMVLSGLATDGGGLSDVFITGFTPFGELIDQSVPLNGSAWQFELLPTESGRYTFYVEATDEAGNQTTVGPFAVDITLPAPYQTYLPIVRR